MCFEALLSLGEMTGIPLFKAENSGRDEGPCGKRRKARADVYRSEGPSAEGLGWPLQIRCRKLVDSSKVLSKVVLTSASIAQSRDCRRLANVAVLCGFVFCRFVVKCC